MSFTTLYDTILARVTASNPGVDLTVTHKTLSLGAENATTGVPAVSYSAGDTITLMLFSKAAQQILRDTGIYVKSDAIGLTTTAISEGDRILDQNSNTYTVVAVKPNPVGDIMVYYEAELTLLPAL